MIAILSSLKASRISSVVISEVLATESKLLQLLPFMNVQGSGYTYNIEKNLGNAQFRKVNGGYTYGAIEIQTQIMMEFTLCLKPTMEILLMWF